MRAIVTGAKGFIGSVLVKELISEGHTVAEINRVNSNGKFSGLSLFSTEDIRDFAFRISDFEPNIVFHLASNTSIAASWENPFDFISSNIKLTENLLESIKLSKRAPLLILLSSSAVYDDSASRIPENFRLSPSSPYAISKLAIETVALRYTNSIIVRPFFTIGVNRRGDFLDEWHTKISSIKSSGLDGILKVGDLSLRRDYLDVDDSAKLLIQVAEKGTPGEIYNLCSGEFVTLSQICEALIYAADCTSKIVVESGGKKDASIKQQVVGDASRIIDLGLKPKFNLGQTIDKIVNAQNK